MSSSWTSEMHAKLYADRVLWTGFKYKEGSTMYRKIDGTNVKVYREHSYKSIESGKTLHAKLQKTAATAQPEYWNTTRRLMDDLIKKGAIRVVIKNPKLTTMYPGWEPVIEAIKLMIDIVDNQVYKESKEYLDGLVEFSIDAINTPPASATTALTTKFGAISMDATLAGAKKHNTKTGHPKGCEGCRFFGCGVCRSKSGDAERGFDPYSITSPYIVSNLKVKTIGHIHKGKFKKERITKVITGTVLPFKQTVRDGKNEHYLAYIPSSSRNIHFVRLDPDGRDDVSVKMARKRNIPDDVVFTPARGIEDLFMIEKLPNLIEDMEKLQREGQGLSALVRYSNVHF